jgi:aerobic carbon-monoxide dehydrogenase medium subunit
VHSAPKHKPSMREFDFHEPGSVLEASRMLADLGDDARLIAGGTALVLALRQRLATPAHLVSLGGIDGLRGISWNERAGLRIGALTPHAEVAESPVVVARYPMLAEMASCMANPQVRNQGTLGGNLCYADPGTDPPGCLLALGAEVVLASLRGERVLKIEDFIVDYYATALAPDEVLTEIRLPPPAADADGRYVRHLRTAAEHRPLLNLAVQVRRSARSCAQARVVLGASTIVPVRLARAEACLQGRSVTAELVAEAALCGAAEIHPIDDLRGSAAYRRDVAAVVLRRTLVDLFGLDRGARE